MASQLFDNQAIGSTKPFVTVTPEPIKAYRNPTTNDKAKPGQMWINLDTHICFWNGGTGNNTSIWATQASAAGALNIGGTVTAGTGFVATTGNVTVSTGSVNVTLGDVVVVAGDIEATNGNITAGGNMVAAGYIESATTLEAADDITTSGGDVVISTATKGVELPGGIRIVTGAGVPANGLALTIGDLYFRTDPAGAASRMYIATAVGTWTNVTCAA